MPSLVLMNLFCYMVDPLGVVPFNIAKTSSVTSITQVKTPSHGFCAVMIDCHNCHCLLINIHLPTDYHSGTANEQLKETLGDLCGFISTVSHDFLILVGDWNTDIQRPCNFTHTVSVSAFLGELNLSLIDLLSDNVSFTYSSRGGFTSWLDNVAVSTSFSAVVTSVRLILDGQNLSDHNPLAFSLNLPAIVVDCPRTVYKPTSISWSKPTSKDIYQYQSIVAQSLVGLGRMLSDDIVLCCNPSCTSHQTLLVEISNQLVTCLKSAADFTIPSAGAGRHPRVAGCSQFVKPELTASQWWHKLWVDAGSPSAGVLFQLKKRAHMRYKYAVRQVRRKEEYLK